MYIYLNSRVECFNELYYVSINHWVDGVSNDADRILPNGKWSAKSTPRNYGIVMYDIQINLGLLLVLIVGNYTIWTPVRIC